MAFRGNCFRINTVTKTLTQVQVPVQVDVENWDEDVAGYTPLVNKSSSNLSANKSGSRFTPGRSKEFENASSSYSMPKSLPQSSFSKQANSSSADLWEEDEVPTAKQAESNAPKSVSSGKKNYLAMWDDLCKDDPVKKTNTPKQVWSDKILSTVLIFSCDAISTSAASR